MSGEPKLLRGSGMVMPPCAGTETKKLTAAIQQQKEDLMKAIQAQRAKGDAALVDAAEEADQVLIAAVRKQKETDDALLQKTREQAARDLAEALRKQQEAHDAEMEQARAEAVAAAAAHRAEKEGLELQRRECLDDYPLELHAANYVPPGPERDPARRRSWGGFD